VQFRRGGLRDHLPQGDFNLRNVFAKLNAFA
jgi:hypothetical protein